MSQYFLKIIITMKLHVLLFICFNGFGVNFDMERMSSFHTLKNEMK